MDKIPLGKLIGITDKAERDAIHIAIAPVYATATLMPGDKVGIVEVLNGNIYVGRSGKPIGIVDPFLTENVKKHDCFYLCLFPYTIESLRHEWIHKDFPDRLQTAQKEIEKLKEENEQLKQENEDDEGEYYGCAC